MLFDNYCTRNKSPACGGQYSAVISQVFKGAYFCQKAWQSYGPWSGYSPSNIKQVCEISPVLLYYVKIIAKVNLKLVITATTTTTMPPDNNIRAMTISQLFGRFFKKKNPSFRMMMSGRAGGCRASPQVHLLVKLLYFLHLSID